MSERRRRLRLKITEAEFKCTGNGLYVWDGLVAALESDKRRVTLPAWIRDYLMDTAVALNRLKFGVKDRRMKPGDAADRVLHALMLRQSNQKKGTAFARYVDVYSDAALMLERRMARKRGEKFDATVVEMEVRHRISRRTIFDRLKIQRERESRHTKLARKHDLLPGD